MYSFVGRLELYRAPALLHRQCRQGPASTAAVAAAAAVPAAAAVCCRFDCCCSRRACSCDRRFFSRRSATAVYGVQNCAVYTTATAMTSYSSCGTRRCSVGLSVPLMLTLLLPVVGALLVLFRGKQVLGSFPSERVLVCVKASGCWTRFRVSECWAHI